MVTIEILSLPSLSSSLVSIVWWLTSSTSVLTVSVIVFINISMVMTITLNINIVSINIDISLKITVTAPAYLNEHRISREILQIEPQELGVELLHRGQLPLSFRKVDYIKIWLLVVFWPVKSKISEQYVSASRLKIVLSYLYCSGFSTRVTLLERESAMLVRGGGLSLIKKHLKKTIFSQNQNLPPLLLLSMKSTQYPSKSIHYS